MMILGIAGIGTEKESVRTSFFDAVIFFEKKIVRYISKECFISRSIVLWSKIKFKRKAKDDDVSTETSHMVVRIFFLFHMNKKMERKNAIIKV